MIIDRKHSRSRSIPLQWLILLAFIVQIFGAVGLVAYLSYRSGQESANKLALRLKTEISTRVTEKTTTYLQALDQVNKNNIIEEISGFLRTIDIQAGTVFIMERDQTLVATSSLTQNPNQPSQNTKDQKLLKAIDSPNLQISGAAKYLRDRNVNLANIRQAEQFEFEINGDRQSVQVTPISDRNGLDWLIVVVIPESDFMADIQANRVWTILLCGIALLVATGVSIITTRWIVAPILRISRASKAIATGEWQEPLVENNAIAEINALSISFNQMAGQLRQSLDQKSAELQDKAYWLNTLIEAIPDPIFMKDGEGRYLLINRQGLKLFEISDIHYFGKTDAEVAELNSFYHDSLLYCAATDVIAWAKREISRTEEQIPQVDGSQIVFDVVRIPLFTESGDRKGLVVVARDISDRKQAELALKQSEQTNRAILNAIPDLLIRVDRDGSCLDFIPPLSEQAGIFLPVVKHISEVLPQDLLNLQLQRIAQALATGELQVWENQIIKNDQICYEEIRVFPCGTDECLVIVRDISARKQTELDLIAARTAAEAATKAKSEFLASMSHEIRTPMNGVIGMTQILGMTELTADQQEFVKTIKDSGEALLTIINDILDFSKIESGMLEIEARDFDLEEVIRGVCQLLKNQTIAKQIDLKYAIAPNIPKTVIGDLARLRQILLNLVGNAVKFTQNGHVSIAVSGKKVRGKYELTFAIADTGIGIASDRLDLLFQAFTQADNSISREYGGTGLGLAISKRLVNLMEGTIWVESLGQVGGNPPIAWQPQPLNPSEFQGSTFYFTTTLLIDQMINQPQTVLAEEFAIDEKFAEKFPLRILLVEDNPVNQMVAKLMLQRLGYQINAIANNGLEALQAVQNYDYDLILMDVQMPKMDGLTATKMIRTGLKSHVRIVAMTADAMPEDRQACLDAGMDDFISKPISIQALMSVASSS